MNTKAIAVAVLAASLGTLGVNAYNEQSKQVLSASVSINRNASAPQAGAAWECPGISDTWLCIVTAEHTRDQKEWDAAHPLVERQKAAKEFMESTSWLQEMDSNRAHPSKKEVTQ
jgi:hypothetical protein